MSKIHTLTPKTERLIPGLGKTMTEVYTHIRTARADYEKTAGPTEVDPTRPGSTGPVEITQDLAGDVAAFRGWQVAVGPRHFRGLAPEESGRGPIRF